MNFFTSSSVTICIFGASPPTKSVLAFAYIFSLLNLSPGIVQSVPAAIFHLSPISLPASSLISATTSTSTVHISVIPFIDLAGGTLTQLIERYTTPSSVTNRV